jgi:hypothetical protein
MATYMKNLKRVKLPSEPSSSSAWKVFRRVQKTRLEGQIMEAGQMRNLLVTPARAKPSSCLSGQAQNRVKTLCLAWSRAVIQVERSSGKSLCTVA